MRALAAVLLVVVAVVHYGADLLAFSYQDHDAARRAIYYVLRSVEGGSQYALIALLVVLCVFLWEGAIESGRVKGAAPTLSSASLVVLVCFWGFLEHIEAGACRLSVGIGTKPPTGTPLTGICDSLTGLPLYAIGLGGIAFLAAVIAAHSLGRDKNA